MIATLDLDRGRGASLACMSFPRIEGVGAGQWRFRHEHEQAGPVRFIAPGEATGREFGLFESVATPGRPGAIPHLHHGFTESFYVLSGRLAVMSGRRWQVLGDGDFAHVPVDGVHAFRAVGDEEARFLILFVPGGPREPYFRGLADLARRATPPTEQEIDELARQNDQVNLRGWESDPVPER